MYFFSSSIITFINEIEPKIIEGVLKVDHRRATPDTAILIGSRRIPRILNT